MRIFYIFALLVCAFLSGTQIAEAHEDYKDPKPKCGEEALLSVLQRRLHYPRELKIDSDWISVAARSHSQGQLALHLGELLFKAESAPGFWDEVALAVVEPIEGGMDPGVIDRNLKIYDLPANNKEIEAMTALTEKLILRFSRSLNENEIVLLAYFLRNEKINTLRVEEQPRMPLADTLAEDPIDRFFLFIAPRIKRFVGWLNSPQMRDLHDSLVANVEAAKLLLKIIAATSNPKELSLAKPDQPTTVEIDLPIVVDGNPPPKKLAKMIEKDFYEASKRFTPFAIMTIGLIRDGLKSPEFAARMQADPRSILNELEERVIPIFKVRSHTNELIRVIDTLYFGTPFPEKGETIRHNFLEAARQTIIPFKAEVSRLKGQATLAQLERQAAETQRKVVAVVDSYNPFAAAPPQSKKIKTRGQARPQVAETQSSAEKLTNELFDLSHFAENSDTLTLDDRAYNFEFIRNRVAGSQVIRFSEVARRELHALEQKEIRRLIGAVLIGYTARSGQGASGVKRLMHEGRNGRTLYEARPGHSDQRLILTRLENGEWLALGVVDKAHFDRSVDRRF